MQVEGHVESVGFLRGDFDPVRIKFRDGRVICLSRGKGHIFSQNPDVVTRIHLDYSGGDYSIWKTELVHDK